MIQSQLLAKIWEPTQHNRLKLDGTGSFKLTTNFSQACFTAKPDNEFHYLVNTRYSFSFTFNFLSDFIKVCEDLNIYTYIK